MSLPQKTFVDYKQPGFGDLGTDTASSIQPFLDGELATAAVFDRSPENLRGRTEISRDLHEDLLYYRDRPRYVLASTGDLSWAGTVLNGGTGVATNAATLTITPLNAPKTNRKGFLRIGTTAVNALTYTVQAAAYASDGLNAVLVEHRNVPGTVTPSCVITQGPVYRIIVVFDASNTAHDAPTVAPIVQAQLAGVPALNGKIVCASDGLAANAILAMAEIALSARTHPAGTSGNASLDVEAHTLNAGALGTFTTGRPLTEGDVVAVRYDYVIEPTGGDADDPKGGVPGGRAESITGRGNTDVSTNLFVLDDYPQYAPGAIPLCKVVNGVLRFLDGTSIAQGTSVAPGTALGTTIIGAGFSGPPTLIVGGGIDTGVTTIQGALNSIDTRLGSLRRETWTASDGTSSTGAHFNGTGAVAAAVAAAPAGGEIFVRAGTYVGTYAATGTYGRILRGESRNRVTLRLDANAASVVGPGWEWSDITLTRSGDFSAAIEIARMMNCTIEANTLGLVGSAASMHGCAVIASATAATVFTNGFSLEATQAYAQNCTFTGPATGVVGAAVNIAGSVQQGEFENCSFTGVSTNDLVRFSSSAGTATRRVTFKNCRFTTAAAAYVLNIPTTTTSTSPLVITFEDCVFSNTNNGQLINASPGAGVEVVFRGCTFQQDNTSTADVTRILAAPVAGGIVRFIDTTTVVGATTTAGNPAAPLIELGGTGGTATAGLVTTDGFRMRHASTCTGLHVYDSIRLHQSSTAALNNDYANLSFDMAGLAAASAAAGVTAFLNVTSASSTRRIRIRGLALLRTPSDGAVRLLFAKWALIEDIDFQNAAVTAGIFTPNVIALEGATLSRGTLPIYRASTIAYSGVSAGTQRAEFLDLTFLDPASTGAGSYEFNLINTTFQRCTSRITSTVAPSRVVLQVGSVMDGCSLSWPTTASTLVHITHGVSVTNNRIVFNNATANAVIVDIGGPFAGGLVVGNQILNVDAATPSLPITAGSGSIVANNAFIGSWGFV